MHPLHVTISVLNVVCLTSALIGYFARNTAALTFGIFVGYWANALAILVAFVVALLLAIRFRSGGAPSTFRTSWLGLANGAFVLLFWSVAFAVPSLLAAGGPNAG
jgi:hypothetical protein